MKKIIFVRHGRAEDRTSEITDFERSLTTKGKAVSRMMAVMFRKTENDPGVFITSPAFRALETAFIFAPEFNIMPEDIRIESDLYERINLKILLGILKTVDGNINSVTLFGHNPAFTEMADRLCAKGCEFMTKTSIAGISFQTNEWSEIKPSEGHIEYFLKPDKSE